MRFYENVPHDSTNVIRKMPLPLPQRGFQCELYGVAIWLRDQCPPHNSQPERLGSQGMVTCTHKASTPGLAAENAQFSC